jgi:putative FmdB family regulatory protein
MPTYDYQCQNCGAYHELICSMGSRKDEIECPRCRGVAEQVILYAPGVLTSNMGNTSQDVAIGRDAEKRWDRIYTKKEKRDKIRRESGKTSLEYVGGEKQFRGTDKKLRFVATPEPKND